MTYNYLLDPKIRNNINIFKNNSIVIFDEAHNICNILENLFSKKISIEELEKLQKLLQIILDFINKERKLYYEKNDYINPLFLLNPKEINHEINNSKNFKSQIGNINFEKIKLFKSLDFESNKNSYIAILNFLN